MNDDQLLCEHCLADNELRDEIRKRGSVIEKCLVCHSTGGQALPVSDRSVRRIFRALVRLYYSEWDYNHHLGGDSLQTLVFGRNRIFNLPENASALDFESVFLVLEDDWYPADPCDITLGGGYWDGGVLWGLRDHLDGDVHQVVLRAFNKSDLELEADVRTLIESVRPDIAAVLGTGVKFSRARIGVKARLKPKSPAPLYSSHSQYLPFSLVDIDRPPVAKATEGRFNKDHVSILYLASDNTTAIAELRPHPGHLVSTAEFELMRPIRVADFSKHDIRGFLNDDRLEQLRRILSFGGILNLPIQPEHQVLYSLTQRLGDALRAAGFEAVSFRSSVGPGINLACFADDAFKQVPESEAVSEVRSLHYEIEPRAAVEQNYDSTEYEIDKDDPLATLFDGLARRS